MARRFWGGGFLGKQAVEMTNKNSDEDDEDENCSDSSDPDDVKTFIFTCEGDFKKYKSARALPQKACRACWRNTQPGKVLSSLDRFWTCLFELDLKLKPQGLERGKLP